MKVFNVTKTIEATPATIWEILTDAPRYPEWDKGVRQIEGTIALGERIKIHTATAPQRTFPVKVREFVPHERMVWLGGMGWLFRGERVFTLTTLGVASTEFRMREEFTGPLTPLISRGFPDLNKLFEEFATALKHRAETMH